MDIKKLIAKAVVEGDEVKVKDYLRRFNVNNKLQDRKTALVIAAEHGNDNMVRLLVRHCKANISKDGEAALHWAALKGHSDTMKTLVQLGADVKAKDEFGLTTLLLAAVIGHSDIVKTLVQLGVDVNANIWGEYTALQWAAMSGHSGTVKTLVQLGADVNAKDGMSPWAWFWGRTALNIAVQRGHSEIVNILGNPQIYQQTCDGASARVEKDTVIEDLRKQLLEAKRHNDEVVQEKDEALRQKDDAVAIRDDVVNANEKLTAENKLLKHDNQALMHVIDCLEPFVKQNYIRPLTQDDETNTEAVCGGGMTDMERERLRRNNTAIINNIDIRPVLDVLFQDGVLTDEDKQQIYAEKTLNDRARKLLDILPRRGTEAYRCFRSALLVCSAHELVNMLDKTEFKSIQV